MLLSALCAFIEMFFVQMLAAHLVDPSVPFIFALVASCPFGDPSAYELVACSWMPRDLYPHFFKTSARSVPSSCCGQLIWQTPAFLLQLPLSPSAQLVTSGVYQCETCP